MHIYTLKITNAIDSNNDNTSIINNSFTCFDNSITLPYTYTYNCTYTYTHTHTYTYNCTYTYTCTCYFKSLYSYSHQRCLNRLFIFVLVFLISET